MASQRSSRPVGFFCPVAPGLRFDALSFTSSPLVIRQPRGFAGTEKIARQRRTALPAAMSRGSLQAGERSALADTRPSVSLLPPLAWTGGRVHRFVRVTGTCAPATLLENEARHQECDPMLPATEFACPRWKVAPAAQPSHLRSPSFRGSRNCKLQKEPLRANENATSRRWTQPRNRSRLLGNCANQVKAVNRCG
jgi:hypothetical protein